MNFRTRIHLLRRHYSKIRDNEETINEIWKDERIPLTSRMEICINNGFYNNLKSFTNDQVRVEIQRLYINRPRLDNYIFIISIMYAKKDYSLLPLMIESATKSFQDIFDLYERTRAYDIVPKPSIALALKAAKLYNEDSKKYYTKYKSLMEKVLKSAPESFINAIKEDNNIKEDFIYYIKNDRDVQSWIPRIIANNPTLEYFFCEEHPELFLNIIYDINKTSKIQSTIKALNLSYPQIIKHLKGENRFSVAYYVELATNDITEHKVYIEALQSLFNLEEAEAEYIARIDIKHYIKEVLLRKQEKNPGYIKRIIELERKFAISNATPLLLKYDNSPLIDELMDLDITTLTEEEHRLLINKLNNLVSKPRLKALDGVETLRTKTVKDLEKDGYLLNGGRQTIIANPRSDNNENAFESYQEVIKIYPDGHKREESNNKDGGHLDMLQAVNSDDPEISKLDSDGEIMFAMALKGYSLFINEGNSIKLIMPDIDTLTIEQIITIKKVLDSINILEPCFHYGFVIEQGIIEEIDDVNKEILLEVLETIYNEKMGYSNSRAVA